MRQTDRQADRDRETETHTDRDTETERQTDRETDRDRGPSKPVVCVGCKRRFHKLVTLSLNAAGSQPGGGGGRSGDWGVEGGWTEEWGRGHRSGRRSVWPVRKQE